MPAMNIHPQLERVAAPRGSAVALGFFDGVHLGHRRVLQAAVAAAGQGGLAPAVFTFTLPPNGFKGACILSPTLKRRSMAALGIAEYMEPPFASFCALTPEQFVDRVLVGCFAARAVFCGDDFTFGAHAVGDVALLRRLCAARGITVQAVEMARQGGEPVSSTRIRAALRQGDVEQANALLGAPYAIDWQVVHGKGLGASRLGTPTINQDYPQGMLVPGSGVYLTRILLEGAWRPAATGIGARPTVDAPGAPVSCETYVPGFCGDVYGQAPLLEFHRRYAPTCKFADLEALRQRILQAGQASQRFFAAQQAAQGV